MAVQPSQRTYYTDVSGQTRLCFHPILRTQYHAHSSETTKKLPKGSLLVEIDSRSLIVSGCRTYVAARAPDLIART